MCGEALPVAERPVLLTWLGKQRISAQTRLSYGDIRSPSIPFYEQKDWLRQLVLGWEHRELLQELVLTPAPSGANATILNVVGPPTTQEGLNPYFEKVALATEKIVGWAAPDSELVEWGERLEGIVLPLSAADRSVVRWIAAMDHLANA